MAYQLLSKVYWQDRAVAWNLAEWNTQLRNLDKE